MTRMGRRETVATMNVFPGLNRMEVYETADTEFKAEASETVEIKKSSQQQSAHTLLHFVESTVSRSFPF